LSACEGGGTVGSTPAAAPTSFVVGGTAASGAPFAGGTVTVVDSAGTVFSGPTGGVTTDANGVYSIPLPLTAKPPFVVMVKRDDRSLVSVVAEAKDSTANITPLTNLIAS